MNCISCAKEYCKDELSKRGMCTPCAVRRMTVVRQWNLVIPFMTIIDMEKELKTLERRYCSR